MVKFFGSSGLEVDSSTSFGPANLINLDGHSSDVSSDDDDYIDLVSDDFMDVDEYAMLQKHFDSVDIPTGIEATIPFLMDPPQSNNKHVTGSSTSSVHATCPIQSQSCTFGLRGINSSSSSFSPEPAQFTTNLTSVSSPSLQIHMDTVSQPNVMDPSSPWLASPPAQSKKKAVTLQHRGAASNLPLGVQSKSRWRRPFQSKKKQHMLSSSANYDPVNQLDAMKLPSGVEPSFWEPYMPEKIKKKVGPSSFDNSSSPHPPGLKIPLSSLQSPFKSNIKVKSAFFNNAAHFDFYDPMGSYHPQDLADDPWLGNFSHSIKNDATGGSSTNTGQPTSTMNKDEILRKFQLFKQFDTVEDHSDHHYSANGSSLKQVV